jgi:hypothetical protein
MSMLRIVDDILSGQGDTHSTFRFHSLVSLRNKWLFLGVPKCACTKSKLILHQAEGLRTCEAISSVHTRKDITVSYLPKLTDLTPDMVEEVLLSDEWFRFSFVRNPYRRIESAFANKIARDAEPQFANHMRRIKERWGSDDTEDVTLEAFVCYVINSPNADRDWHWRTQRSILTDDVRWSFIGRVERYEADMAYVLRRLYGSYAGFDIAGHCNASNAVDRVDKPMADAIYSAYIDDFQTYHYSRDCWRG